MSLFVHYGDVELVTMTVARISINLLKSALFLLVERQKSDVYCFEPFSLLRLFVGYRDELWHLFMHVPAPSVSVVEKYVHFKSA